MIDRNAIKALMKEKGLNHTTLAQKAGVSRPAVTKLLNNIGDPKYTTILHIVLALELNPEECFKTFFAEK